MGTSMSTVEEGHRSTDMMTANLPAAQMQTAESQQSEGERANEKVNATFNSSLDINKLVSQLPQEIIYDIYGSDEIYYGNRRRHADKIEDVIAVLDAGGFPQRDIVYALESIWFRIRDTSEAGIWLLPTKRLSRKVSRMLLKEMSGVVVEFSTYRESGDDRRPYVIALELEWDAYERCWVAQWAHDEYARSKRARDELLRLRVLAGRKEKQRRITVAQKALGEAIFRRKMLQYRHVSHIAPHSVQDELARMDEDVQTLELALAKQRATPCPNVPIIEDKFDIFDVETSPYSNIPYHVMDLLDEAVTGAGKSITLEVMKEIQQIWESCVDGEWDLCNGVFRVLSPVNDRT